MEKLQFDLTNQEGLINARNKLKYLENSQKMRLQMKINLKGIFHDFTDMISNFINRFFDLFDDTKKLEKQMELAIKTIEISRSLGAKSIDITINSKNESKLKSFIVEIDAEISGELSKDNTITYSIRF